MGISLVLTGEMTDGRDHLDRVIAAYNPAEHRPLGTRFGHDVRVSALSWRALALWMLGRPDAALADAAQALRDAREIGHAATLMFALSHTSFTLIHCGNYAAARALIEELVALAGAKGSLYWKAYGSLLQGWLCVLTGQAANAIPVITSAMTDMRSTGATAYAPWYLTCLARAYADVGQLDDARRCVAEAMAAVKATRERWYEADMLRIAGEIALMVAPDVAEAEEYFQRSLAVARQQEARSWELRAATSLARLRADQGKPQLGRDLLTAVLCSFKEGLDTRDLEQARSVLEMAL
jgi:predicted ATPase